MVNCNPIRNDMCVAFNYHTYLGGGLLMHIRVFHTTTETDLSNYLFYQTNSKTILMDIIWDFQSVFHKDNLYIVMESPGRVLKKQVSGFDFKNPGTGIGFRVF